MITTSFAPALGKSSTGPARNTLPLSRRYGHRPLCAAFQSAQELYRPLQTDGLAWHTPFARSRPSTRAGSGAGPCRARRCASLRVSALFLPHLCKRPRIPVQVEFDSISDQLGNADVTEFAAIAKQVSQPESLMLFLADVALRDVPVLGWPEVMQPHNGLLAGAILLVNLGHCLERRQHEVDNRFAEILAFFTAHRLVQCSSLRWTDEVPESVKLAHGSPLSIAGLKHHHGVRTDCKVGEQGEGRQSFSRHHRMPAPPVTACANNGGCVEKSLLLALHLCLLVGCSVVCRDRRHYIASCSIKCQEAA